MGKRLFHDRAVWPTRTKMRCPRFTILGILSFRERIVELNEMVEILKRPYTATVALQKRDLTPDECLLHWKQVAFKWKSCF